VEWSDQAACLSAEPEQFFPVGGAAAARWETVAAKQVCERCAVMAECRDYALATRQPFGVWGGLDEEERRALLAERQVAMAAN
jgi:WhiB family redox-sensing transcriptional regulator